MSGIRWRVNYHRGRFLERGNGKGSGSDTICEVRPPRGTSLGRLCLHLQPSTACLITLSLMSQGGQTAYNQSLGSLSGLHSNSKTCFEFFFQIKNCSTFPMVFNGSNTCRTSHNNVIILSFPVFPKPLSSLFARTFNGGTIRTFTSKIQVLVTLNTLKLNRCTNLFIKSTDVNNSVNKV